MGSTASVMFVQTTTTVLVAMLLQAAMAYGKYEDAMKKYLHWQQKYAKYSGLPVTRQEINKLVEVEAATRPQRHVGPHLQRTDTETRPIFLPHRPSDGGRQFSVDEVTQQTNLLGLEGLQLYNPDLVRGSRAPEELPQNNEVTLGGNNSLSHYGTPLYKLRKKYPLGYGRRKREAQNIFSFSRNDLPTFGHQNNQRFDRQNNQRFVEQNNQRLGPQNRPRSTHGNRPRLTRQTGWTLLDPATGRPIEQETKDDFFNDPLNRDVRKPFEASPDALIETHWEDNDGNKQPIYKYHKRYPFGYSG